MAETMTWQPIETAPKDGSAFLGFLPHFAGYFADQRIQRCMWTGWGGGCWECELEKGCIGPTHWMPLPPPPAASGRSLDLSKPVEG